MSTAGFDGKVRAGPISKAYWLATTLAVAAVAALVSALFGRPDLVARFVSPLPFPQQHDWFVLAIQCIPLLGLAWMASKFRLFERGIAYWLQLAVAGALFAALGTFLSRFI
jgi:hypothetical protein